MKEQLTEEQKLAVAAQGKVLVSASAGSGKTFVMIKKLADYIQSGGDLDGVLAVTFTKKAAAQMKEKLRSALISRLPEATAEEKENIKKQLNKISSADISTIHSFCSHLIRTYFYAADADSSFDIMSEDDSLALTLKKRAMDNLFDRLYEEENADFIRVLNCLKRKRSDESVKKLILDGYASARAIADYAELLENCRSLFTESGFDRVCGEIHSLAAERCRGYLSSLEEFAASFKPSANAEKYNKILGEMRVSLSSVVSNGDIFAPLPKLHSTPKPRETEENAAENAAFTAFRDGIKEGYSDIYDGLSDRQTELSRFLSSGELAAAFSSLILQFDAEYTAVKRDEGKLDYNDLEHLTLKLLKDESVLLQIKNKYKCVFVDEYQDVNPVQERILGALGADLSFMVGDVKQAIYGFRGSKSVFFSQKYDAMKERGGALKLTSNFRSSDGVINFVNSLFSDIMTEGNCGFDYASQSVMRRGGKYPEGEGTADITVFGKDSNSREEAEGVYSVAERTLKKSGHTREGLAVLEIVKKELSSKHYDPESKTYADTQPGDICILTRKNGGKSANGIIKALTDAGYGVAGAKETNVCNRPEVREMLDILSFIDNCRQDIPMVTAMLSPVGGFTYDELAEIRISYPREIGKRAEFRECVSSYIAEFDDALADKIRAFAKRINAYRKLSDILGAAALIERILQDTGLAALYSAEGGDKLASIRRLCAEAYSPYGELTLNAFLSKLKAGGYEVKAPAATSSDSIKIMTMHASKGLEFPVVIIADIAASFRGNEYEEMPFDDEYGFAPKYYDEEKRVSCKTVLQALCAERARREEVKNEFNLFYVACTRAMCNLHIMCEEIKRYNPYNVTAASCYAGFFDVAAYSPRYAGQPCDFEGEGKKQIIIGERDEEAYAKISRTYSAVYPYLSSVDLPVKSSASQILRANGEEEYYKPRAMFAEEDEDAEKTGAERGIAYHKYLELCDFSVKDADGIAAEINKMVKSGKMTERQSRLISTENLVKILSMPVFSSLGGATLYREREFLCKLPANAFTDTDAEDGVLVQGVIDLLAVGSFGTAIIDYKYSHKSDEEIVKTYSPQLKLYKKVVATVLKIDESTIRTTIVNIYRRSEIGLDI